MTLEGHDSALETLWLPFASGALSWPDDGALFLRARDGWPLHRQPVPGLVCVQGFKPEYDRLQRSGLQVDAAGGDRFYSLVLLLPPRQRDEARALFAEAVACLQPGGIVIASMANDEGAKSGEADLARLAGPLHTLSKNKCRVFWTSPLQGPVDADLAAQWRELDAPRPILDGRYTSRPGLFAWDRIDAASALLAQHLPHDLAGTGADLGAGYGYLAAEVLARCARVTALDLYEAEARALELARINLAPFAARAALGFHWHDVTSGLPQRYDFIVSNPPFHAQGRADRPDIGRRFIAAAAEALQPGGRLWLVANCHLPYEAVLDARFGTVRTVTQQGGFKVVEAVKARR
ncbi:16S rRNA (guanine1207-N2)-methyltransferase [Luteimonas cucumeris]|uniref:16S rRNA (Guanine1207-N2)-methyltransferase n=1 Tax=Luteimonas cucumeris TaxID=985012 RepID=A0A562LEJ6_9GAMM|nr:class I SAM-dependent methyltransferase [Luteimonas cucumeris]TWI05996.1 16S rRNA (guanine1207-N2)-methyltransferase [Luteimonas cucumeris]